MVEFQSTLMAEGECAVSVGLDDVAGWGAILAEARVACRQRVALGMEAPDVRGNSDMETPPMAIMESHFGYEERQLTAVLDALTAPDPAIRSLL